MIYSRIEDTLNRALALLERVDEVYQLGGPRVRRPANQCFFDKLLIELDDDAPIVTETVLQEPWATLQAKDFQQRMAQNATNPDQEDLGRGSNMMTLVHPALHNANLSALVAGEPVVLASAHAKVRRDGYTRGSRPVS
jgi:hypothetical protein